MGKHMNAIIFGATGMVGYESLVCCLSEKRISSVVSVGRRSVGIDDPKLKEVIHSDFTDYSGIRDEIAKADVCYYCIGVYQGKVPKDQFWEITVDYLQALIASFEELNPGVIFCLFSAQGADQAERRPILFAKAKGRAERILFESKIGESYAFRPGFINPVRKDKTSGVALWFFRALYKLLPMVGVDADRLAKVMVRVGIEKNALRVFENRDLRGYDL